MTEREKMVALVTGEHNAVVDKAIENHSTFGMSYGEQIETEADYLLANGVTFQKWIPVSERLPDDREKVLIWCGSLQVARIVNGISEETRAAMKRGELLDPDIPHWCLSEGLTMHKRSSIYCFGDVHGNNSVPYRWESVCGPTSWFGQDVTHWMPLPEPPKEDN